MFEIKLDEDNELVFTGDFSVGRLGTYKKNNVSVDVGEEFIKSIGALCDDGAIDLSRLNKYYIQKQNQILNNIEQIENRFLIFLMNDYFGCGDAFWADEDTDKLCKFVIKAKLPKLEKGEYYSDFLYAEKIFTQESDIAFYQGRNPFDEDIYDYLNSVNINMKEYMAKYFPMFDMKAFMDALVGEYCTLSEDSIDIELSNPECGYCSVCNAFVRINSDYTLEEWHHR